jgi:ribonuclease P protein component
MPTFHKTERIVSQKTIDELFTSGQSKSLAAFPLRVVYMEKDEAETTQVLVSVSKRHFKHAVDRNRVKRQIREAYRLNKQILTGTLPENKHLAIAFIWLSDSHAPTDVITSRMRTLLKRIAKSSGQLEEKEQN